MVAVLNFTPVPRDSYRIGVPEAGAYAELVNSDAGFYGGGNVGNGGAVATEPIAAHGHDQSINLRLPPLGFLLLKPEADEDRGQTRVRPGGQTPVSSSSAAHLLDPRPLLVGHRHHRQPRQPHERERRERLVGLDRRQRHRPRQLLHRHDIDRVELAGLVRRIRIRSPAAFMMPTTDFSAPV